MTLLEFIAKAREVQEIGRCYSCDEAIEYEDCTCSEVGELALKRDQFSRINFCRMLDVLEKQAASLEFYESLGPAMAWGECIEDGGDTARACLRECENILGGGE